MCLRTCRNKHCRCFNSFMPRDSSVYSCKLYRFIWAMSWKNLSSEVCDQVRLKQACSATKASGSLEILDLASIGIILSKQWTTKMLIRLCTCAGWSAPLLFPYGTNRFSHDVAHLSFSFLRNVSLNANSTDPDLLPCSVTSDKNISCLPSSTLGDPRHKWGDLVKYM